MTDNYLHGCRGCAVAFRIARQLSAPSTSGCFRSTPKRLPFIAALFVGDGCADKLPWGAWVSVGKPCATRMVCGALGFGGELIFSRKEFAWRVAGMRARARPQTKRHQSLAARHGGVAPAQAWKRRPSARNVASRSRS